MLQFFKYVLATIVGLFLFLIVSFFLMIAIGAAFSGGEKTELESNSILKLNLNRPIKDFVPKDDSPFSSLEKAFNSGTPSAVGIVQIQKALANAKIDPNIKGIYLEATSPTAGYANLEEVREALIDFKKSGKFIYAYGEFYMEKGYYLASVADKIYLNPAGLMDFNGLSAEYTFYKGSLDKLEIKPVIFKVGTFKSAVEPFLLDKMSDANREQSASFLNSINDYVYQKLAESRGVSVAEIKNTADNLLAFKPKGALASKLITNIGYYTDVEAALKKASKQTGELKYITLTKYLETKLPIEEKYNSTKVAVLSSEGEIGPDGTGEETITAEKFVKELRKLREDKNVKAVVLRINSPGGSALASDVMWNEVEQTKKVKPVVASFSDVAASGGYYMGMGADAIVAQPTTITGSIGIFMILFNAQNFLKNKLGVTFDHIGTNANSEFPSVTREMSDFEKQVLQNSTDEGYENFTSKAAKGRKMKIDQLKSLAEGRVWSGSQAKANGLVDELGGLKKAIELAATKAKLKKGDYAVKYPYSKKSLFESLMNDEDEDEASVQTKVIQKVLGNWAPLANKLQNFKTMEGIQARLEYDLELK